MTKSAKKKEIAELVVVLKANTSAFERKLDQLEARILRFQALCSQTPGRKIAKRKTK